MGNCQKIPKKSKKKGGGGIMVTKKKQTKTPTKKRTTSKKTGRARAKKYKINPDLVREIKKRRQKRK